jgi:phi13 family phage major tail protein
MPDNDTTPAVNEVYSTIGLRAIVVAKLLTDETDSTPTYEPVQPLIGAIDLDVSDNSGDPDAQYYDDGEHDVVLPDPELSGTIELADLPPEKQALLLGYRVDKNGVVIHNADDKPPYFAWGFKSKKSNGVDRYVWYYKGRCTMPQDKHTTKQKDLNRQTQKLKVTFVKLNSTGNARAFVDEDSEAFATAKATFFNAPYTPDFD